MPKIFCCYRHDDSKHQTGRIVDHLTARFGRNALFRDVDSIPAGLDYRRVLSAQVGRCDVLLVIIGDAWLTSPDQTGGRRLDNPNDWVRLEIETALHRDIPVIPILVGQASLPRPDHLPESIRDLAYRESRKVRPDPDFHHDIDRLIIGINEAIGAGPTESTTAKSAHDPVPDVASGQRLPHLGEHTRDYLDNVLKAPRVGDALPSDSVSSSPARGRAAADPIHHAPHVALRRGLYFAIAALATLPVGIVIAILMAQDRGDRGSTPEDAIVESRRADILHQVESLRRRRTETLKSDLSSEWADVLPAVDYSSFEILSDDRVVDLRQWKPVPPGGGSDLICAASMSRRLWLRKDQPADEIRFEFRTTGDDVFLSCPSHPNAFRVARQRSVSFVGEKATKVRQLIVDVRHVPVGVEFAIRTSATYWNSLQKDDDLWFGAMGYEHSFKVSLLILFPDQKPFSDYRLMVAPTKNDKPRDFEGRKIILTPEDRSWMYWEVPDPKAGYVYSLFWTW